MTNLILLGLSSFGVAIFGSMIGVGGGIFMVPIMVLGFSIPIKTAISAILFAMVPYSLLASWINHRNHLIFFKLGILLEIPTVLGVVLGSYFCSFLDQEILRKVFGIIITLAGLLMIGRGGAFLRSLGACLKKINSRAVLFRIERQGGESLPIGGILLVIFGLLAGVTAGLLGVGGGWIKTPMMILLFGLAPNEAAATAIFMISMTSFTGAVSHSFMGELNLPLIITLLICYPLGAVVGSSFLPKLKGGFHKKLIGVGVAGAGVAMLLSTFL